MADQFELALWTPEPRRLAVADCLKALAAGKTWTENDLDKGGMILIVGGKDRMARWVLGSLLRLASQCAAAAGRLADGKTAVVRSAAVDDYHVPFLLMEPQADNTSLLSLVLIPDPATSLIFPNGPDAAAVQRLYDYLAAHRQELLESVDPADPSHFVSLPFSTPLLVDSLRREHARVGEFYERLNLA